MRAAPVQGGAAAHLEFVPQNSWHGRLILSPRVNKRLFHCHPVMNSKSHDPIAPKASGGIQHFCGSIRSGLLKIRHANKLMNWKETDLPALRELEVTIMTIWKTYPEMNDYAAGRAYEAAHQFHRARLRAANPSLSTLMELTARLSTPCRKPVKSCSLPGRRRCRACRTAIPVRSRRRNCWNIFASWHVPLNAILKSADAPGIWSSSKNSFPDSFTAPVS